MCGDHESTMTVHELRQSNDIGKLKRLTAQVIHTEEPTPPFYSVHSDVPVAQVIPVVQ